MLSRRRTPHASGGRDAGTVGLAPSRASDRPLLSRGRRGWGQSVKTSRRWGATRENDGWELCGDSREVYVCALLPFPAINMCHMSGERDRLRSARCSVERKGKWRCGCSTRCGVRKRTKLPSSATSSLLPNYHGLRLQFIMGQRLEGLGRVSERLNILKSRNKNSVVNRGRRWMLKQFSVVSCCGRGLHAVRLQLVSIFHRARLSRHFSLGWPLYCPRVYRGSICRNADVA